MFPCKRECIENKGLHLEFLKVLGKNQRLWPTLQYRTLHVCKTAAERLSILLVQLDVCIRK